MPPLEPKLFSFNSPAGACPACDGLGYQEFFDPARVVMHPQLSLAGGAIRGWDRRNAYYFQMIRALSQHFSFDIEAPGVSLPAQGPRSRIAWQRRDRDRIPLYRFARPQREEIACFEGILPNLDRRYREDGILHGARRTRQVPRARAAVPNAVAAGSTAPPVTCMWPGTTAAGRTRLSVAKAMQHYNQLQVSGWRGEIAVRIVKEVADRLRFLVDVGLDYLTLDRSAETLSGGEAQRIRLASQVGSGLTGVLYILDEPSIGLHQRDNQRLLATLQRLRDLGNTVLVVEHDEKRS